MSNVDSETETSIVKFVSSTICVARDADTADAILENPDAVTIWKAGGEVWDRLRA